MTGIFDGAVLLGCGQKKYYDGYAGTWTTKYNLYALKGRIIAARERYKQEKSGPWWNRTYRSVPTGDYETFVCSENEAIQMLLDGGILFASFVDKLPGKNRSADTLRREG